MAPRKISGCIRKQALPCWKDEKDAMTLQRQKVQRQQQRFLRQKIPQTKLSRLKWFSVTSLLLPLQPLLLFFPSVNLAWHGWVNHWLTPMAVEAIAKMSDMLRYFVSDVQKQYSVNWGASLCVPKVTLSIVILVGARPFALVTLILTGTTFPTAPQYSFVKDKPINSCSALDALF